MGLLDEIIEDYKKDRVVILELELPPLSATAIGLLIYRMRIQRT